MRFVLRQMRRSNQIEPVIRHQTHHAFILDRHHLMQRQRRVPFVRAEIDHQRDNRRQFVVFMESRKVFPAVVALLPAFFPRFPALPYLLGILHRVIQHIAHRHGVVNVRLVLYAEHEIRVLVIPHTHPALKNVARFLVRLRNAVHAIREHPRGGVHFTEILRFDHLLAVVNQKIKRVGKDVRSRHEFFGNRVFVPHRNRSPFVRSLSLLYYSNFRGGLQPPPRKLSKTLRYDISLFTRCSARRPRAAAWT